MELPKGPSYPCCNSRSSPTYPSQLERNTRVPPTCRGAPFPTPGSRGGIHSLCDRVRIPSDPVASQEEALSTSKARGTAGSFHHFQSPPDVSLFQGNLFPCTASTFKPRIDSHHGGTWDSLVGKPRWKASWETPRESHRSLDPHEGKRDTAATALEESTRACPHLEEDCLPWVDSRSTPRSMSLMERNPQVLAQTPQKILGPGIDGRGIPRGLRATRMGTGLS